MIPGIALVGHARAGKDTIAQHLVTQHGFTQIALADQLKNALLVLNPIVPISDGYVRIDDLVAERGWEGAKSASHEIRRLMQTLGTEIARELFGQNVWIRLAVRSAQPFFDRGRPVVISDVRFPNEASTFRRLGLLLIKVERPGTLTLGSHASERAIDTIDCDRELVNDSTLAELHARIDSILAEATGSPSPRPPRANGR